MREGTDVTLVSFGKLVGYDLEVAEKLEKEGISVEVTYPFFEYMQHLVKSCSHANLPCTNILQTR